MEILVSANLPNDAAARFESAVSELLAAHGAKVCIFRSEDYVMVRGTATAPALEMPADVEATPPAEPPAAPEGPAVQPLDEPIPQPVEEPIASVAPPISGEVCLKELSSNHAVPFGVDPIKQFTELKVKELRDLGDHVSFVFCGMAFKFPTPPSINGVVNSPIPPTSAAVRAMVEFVGVEIDLQPVLFNLVECTENEPHCVVFGADMMEVISSLTKKVPSETQPA